MGKKILTFMFVSVMAMLAFTACSNDDEPIAEVTYTYGFPKMSASHPGFLEEMGK